MDTATGRADPDTETWNEDLAGAVLEVVPAAMRAIRIQMRAGLGGISIPQFRLLLFVRRHPGTSLSPAAEHLGVTVPACSQLVDRLVRSGYLDKRQSARERRMVELSLTDRGKAALAERDERTRAWLRDALATIDPEERLALEAALPVLRSIARRGPAASGEDSHSPR